MLKEGSYAEKGSQESIEQEPSFSKEAIKHFLETRNSVTDSGRSGILFRIAPEELDPKDQELLALGNEDNPEGSLSIKALKVFNLADAQKEFSALQEARRIILKKMESSSDPIFHIPRAIRLDEIDVDEKTEKFLNANGALITGGKVGTITMDWIEGKNLAVILYEELMKRSPESEELDPGSFRDVQDFRKLLRALEKTDFVLPKEILAQIKNGIKALHEGKLYHNDNHLGNVIVKDGRLEDGQTFSIDYADATHEKKTINEADGNSYLSDENMVQILSPLTRTPEEKRKERDESIRKEWDERLALLEQQPKAQAQYKTLKGALDAGSANVLEGQLLGASGSDRDVENYLGNLLKLSRESGAYREQISAFLAKHANDKKSKMRSFALNRIQALQKAIEI
jgi:hypothetical protein